MADTRLAKPVYIGARLWAALEGKYEPFCRPNCEQAYNGMLAHRFLPGPA